MTLTHPSLAPASHWTFSAEVGTTRNGSVGVHNLIHEEIGLLVPSLTPSPLPQILVLHHQTTMAVGYTPIIHCGVVSQCARIEGISGIDGAPLSSLRTGDRAIIACRWSYKPEFIHPGELHHRVSVV